MFQKICHRAVVFTCLLTFFVTLFGYLARWVDLAEFVVSLRPVYLGVSLILLIITGLTQQKITMRVMMISVLINGAEIAPYYWPQSKPADHQLTLLFYNVDKIRMPNVGVGEVVTLVQTHQPDIAVLREVGKQPAAALLTALSADYPHTFAYQHEARDGVLILSQHPLGESKIIDLSDWRPAVAVDVHLENGTFHLVSPHPPNPFHAMEERNKQLPALAKYVRDAPRPLVVAGDLNVTMWSGWYKQIERAGVRNVRRGNGILPTWRVPGFGFQVPLIYFPLDHVLVSEGVGVFSAETLVSPGSDHQPLLVRLHINN